MRRHPEYLAFLVHRISGLALALFLPVHFLVLGLAVEGEAAMDEFLTWADQPAVRLVETLLIVLLTAHMAGGLRLLITEIFGWTEHQRTLIALGFASALGSGLLFLILP